MVISDSKKKDKKMHLKKASRYLKMHLISSKSFSVLMVMAI